MTTDLKPCPFCGGGGLRVRNFDGEHGPERWTAECDGKDCAVDVGWHPTEAEAIAAWNRRAPTDDAMNYVRTLKELTFLQGLVLSYFRAKKYADEAWAPGGTTADRETWANAEMEAEEHLRKAVMK